MWGKPKIDPEAPIPIVKKIKLFCGTHLMGIVAFITPIFFLFILAHPFPPQKWQWCAYTLCVMATYWVFECIPLPITSFFPIIIFPLTEIMTTRVTCLSYINDTIIMFLGSIMLAASVEQSGLHRRLALYAIKIIGYSHVKMLFAISFVTMFISMWITNTAAATMMVPILFALLRVYEGQKLYKIYDEDPKTGEKHSTPLTSCYFCAVTYSATIGGIGTLVGTATNLVFKGLFVGRYPNAPEYISFPLYSAWAVPYMILLNACMYLYLAILYMGLFRPNSAAAKSIKITPEGLKAAKEVVEKDIKDMGPISCHEIMVLILFGAAILMFFARSPQVFPGWADVIIHAYGLEAKFIKDSAAATFIIFLMCFLPSNAHFFKNCKAKYVDELTHGPVQSVLDWNLMNKTLPYSFCFLLAGGFSLSKAAGDKYSDLNGKIGHILEKMDKMPNLVVMLVVIVFTVFVTNFASNVAICNVFAPIAMGLAEKLHVNPLWYCLAAGVSASYCFMIPVGTPGNLIVQSAAKIPTPHMISLFTFLLQTFGSHITVPGNKYYTSVSGKRQMAVYKDFISIYQIVAGAGPTVTTILLTWVLLYLYAPIIWPVLHQGSPSWITHTL